MTQASLITTRRQRRRTAYAVVCVVLFVVVRSISAWEASLALRTQHAFAVESLADCEEARQKLARRFLAATSVSLDASNRPTLSSDVREVRRSPNGRQLWSDIETTWTAAAELESSQLYLEQTGRQLGINFLRGPSLTAVSETRSRLDDLKKRLNEHVAKTLLLHEMIELKRIQTWKENES